MRRVLKLAALRLPAVRRVFNQRDAALRALVAAEHDRVAAAALVADRDALVAALEAEQAARARAEERDHVAAAELEAERAARTETAEGPPLLPCLGWDGAPHLEAKGLFIVGHARSGTSILLEALNDSPEVFLLGEANLHQNGLMPGFAGWYNKMHREFCNPPAKSSYCPLLAGPGANGVDYLHALAQRYAFVGEKVAFRDVTLGYKPDSFFEFQSRYFFNSHYICVLRDPVSVLRSNAAMFGPERLDPYIRSYMQTLLLILNLYRTLPRVSVLVHERISAGSFLALGERLGLDLSDSYAYYKSPLHVFEYSQIEVPALALQLLRRTYEQFCSVFSPDTLRDISKLDLLSLHREVQVEHAVLAETRVVSPLVV